jgi:hypothetical protein
VAENQPKEGWVVANLEKHKKNPLHEWMEAEESTLPAQPRSSHVLGAYIKIPKALARKTRRITPQMPPAKPEPALAREAAPPAKLEEKHSQASSPEHLRRLSRLPKLRAPFTPNSRPAPGARG